MTDSFDLVVIGAGPAGLAAATLAAELGLGVLVLDEHDAPGGQIYRRIEAVSEQRPEDFRLMGQEYREGLGVVRAFRSSSAVYWPGSTVWNVDRDGRLSFTTDGRAYEVRASHLIVATGAMERAVPIPGWTLPGVMGAGGAQLLLKDAGIVPAGRVVLAGSGPLLFLVATQLAAAGVHLESVLQTTPRLPEVAVLGELAAAVGAYDYLRKGLSLLAATRRATRLLHGIEDLAAEGERRLERLHFRHRSRQQEIVVDTLLLHEGVVPNTQVTRLLGCHHVWNHRQHCWRPETDDWGQTDIPTVTVAGDCSGIVGARAAEESGRLAALAAACRLGIIDAGERDRLAAPIRRAQARHLRIRPFLDRLYPPSPLPEADDLVLCRCEEVTRGMVIEAVDLGCLGANQVKAFTRAGMGPCQGRMCALAVAQAIAARCGLDPGAIEPYRVRPPLTPIRLAELVGLNDQ